MMGTKRDVLFDDASWLDHDAWIGEKTGVEEGDPGFEYNLSSWRRTSYKSE